MSVNDRMISENVIGSGMQIRIMASSQLLSYHFLDEVIITV